MDSIKLTCDFPVSADTLYTMWLDSEQHSAFTGGLAAIENKEHSRYTTWGGYITGRLLELEFGKRILMTWRTTEFPDGVEDSTLEITFQNTETGCELHLNQWDIPDGQGSKYEDGWKDYYFNPMTEYFAVNK